MREKRTGGTFGNVLIESQHKTFKNGVHWEHDLRWIWVPGDNDFTITNVIPTE